MHVFQMKHIFEIPSDSEASASELLENERLNYVNMYND